MYVNYLLRVGERNQLANTKYSKTGSLRYSSLNYSPVSPKPFFKHKPRRLPPLNSLDSSLPLIIESFPLKIDSFSSCDSDDESYEELNSILSPRFAN